jgi:hypothetical protein
MNCPAERTLSFWRQISKPFYFLLFLYFFVVSGELLGLKIGIFKLKLNVLVGSILFLLVFLSFRILRLDRDFLLAALCCLGSLVLSAIFGYHWFACLAFLCYFVFNYFVFFVLPVNFFYYLEPGFILRLYFISFILVGLIAAAQVFFSLVGVVLPFVTQYIGPWSRGQGFSYEPSYYALYMTPFTMFYTAKFFLQEKSKRSIGKLIGSNCLLLVSTSTGCFFSYLAFLLGLGFMKWVRAILRPVRNCEFGPHQSPYNRRSQTGTYCINTRPFAKPAVVDSRELSRWPKFTIFDGAEYIGETSFFQIIWKTSLAVFILFCLLWAIDSKLVSHGFLKLFWTGIVQHQTFQARWIWICEYWNIFLEHPVLGTGLGGASAYYAQKNGIQLAWNDPDILEVGIAMNVTTEVLGSLGLVGAGAFGYFFIRIWKNCRRTLRLALTEEERIDILSLIISMGVMFFTLQFSQSILRAYTWLHVGICVGYMKYLQAKYRSRL